MAERFFSPQPQPTPEQLRITSELRQKIDGNVVWERGDTQDTYQVKAAREQLQRVQDIKAGLPTWLRSNYDGGIGARYDFFRDGRCVGTVVVDEMDCDVFDANSGPEGPQPIVRRPGLQLAEAVEIVEAHGL